MSTIAGQAAWPHTFRVNCCRLTCLALATAALVVGCGKTPLDMGPSRRLDRVEPPPPPPPQQCATIDLGSALGSAVAEGSTDDAEDVFEGACAGVRVAPDVGFSWTAPSAGVYSFDTFGSDFDTVLIAQRDCEITDSDVCNDDAAAQWSQVELLIQQGESVVVVLGGFNGARGQYTLNVGRVGDPPEGTEICDDRVDNDADGAVDCDDADCARSTQCGDIVPPPPPPPPGECPMADLGTVLGNPVASGETFDLPNAVGSECGGMTAPEASFRWTAPWDGFFQFDTAGSGFDTVLHLSLDDAGSCASSTPMECNDDAFDLQSAVTMWLWEGESALVFVDGFGESAGPYRLNISALEEINPENCFNGVDDDADGLRDCDDPDCDTECFPPPPPPPPVREQCANGVDDDRDGLRDCEDDDCWDDDRCRVPPPPPPECWSEDLGSALGTQVARGQTTGQPSQLAGSCGGEAAPEVVFRWTAPRSDLYQFNTYGSNYDSLLYILQGELCDGRELSCNDDARNGLQSEVEAFVEAGEVVLIVVDGFGDLSGGFNLNILGAELIPDRVETGDLCRNGWDDDGDGLADCADMDCASECSTFP